LLNKLADVLIEYLIGQVNAGARMIQVFDSWAGLLHADVYERFALPPIRRISAALKETFPDVPRAIFARGAHQALEALSVSDFDVISLDWTMDARQSRRRTGPDVTLQGNLDPAVLYASPDVIEEHVQVMLQRFGTDRYIANLGHGMLPDHNPDHAAAFVAAVHKHSRATI
jgi:uroporphyrinogen decarboxylase